MKFSRNFVEPLRNCGIYLLYYVYNIIEGILKIKNLELNMIKIRKFYFCLIILFLFQLSNFCEAAHLILINGASCAGKSSVSKALKTVMQSSDHTERWEIQSIDAFIRDISKETESGTGSSSVGSKDEKSQHSKAISSLARFFEPFHTKILDRLRQGVNVIVDHCFSNDELFKNALYHFKDQEVFFVKIYTNYATAMQRLKARNADSSCPEEHRSEPSVMQHYGMLGLDAVLCKSLNEKNNQNCSIQGRPKYMIWKSTQVRLSQRTLLSS